VTREIFQERMAELEASALGGLDIVVEQLDRTLEALEHVDVELAELIIADDDRVDGRYLEVHQGVLSLLALQAPVAGDLRLVAAILHVIRCVERMGDQCVNIAKVIPLSGHEPPVRTVSRVSIGGPLPLVPSAARRALEEVRAVAFGDASAYLLTLDFSDTAGAVADLRTDLPLVLRW